MKNFKFGLGSVFSLIVVYFIYLYSVDKEWVFLSLLSKWYLIIVGGIFLLVVGIALIIILLTLFGVMVATLKLRKQRRRVKKSKSHVLDAEYDVKE